MYSEELRPLKRPRLGVPDVYPQENRQKEVSGELSPPSQGRLWYHCPHAPVPQDDMTDYHVQKGFSNKPTLSREV